MVTDMSGDAEADPDRVLGLFYRDVRHLSRWRLTVDGSPLQPLSTGASGYPAATFFLAGLGGNVYADPTLSVIRSRVLGQGDGEDLHETLTVTNCGRSVVVVELAVAFDAQLADLFEVKDQQPSKMARVLRRVDGSRVTLTYRRQDYLRRTVIDAPGATLSQGTATFLLTLAAGRRGPRRSPSRSSRRHPGRSSPVSPDGVTAPSPVRGPNSTCSICRDGWMRPRPCGPAGTASPTPTGTAWSTSPRCASPRDPATGRPCPPPDCPGSWHCSAGTASSPATRRCPFVPRAGPHHAAGARRAAGHRFDDFRDAEPGKILHELRHGELAHFGERPQSPYFGSADATPLFLSCSTSTSGGPATGDRCGIWSRGPGGAGLDRALRRHRRRRLHRVPDPQPDHRPGQPVLEGLLELDRAPGRAAGHAAAGLLRDPGVRLRRAPRTARLAREVWDDPGSPTGWSGTRPR